MSDVDSETEVKEEEPTIGVYEGGRNELKQRHGNGKMTFVNGDTYEGEYVEGKRRGHGVYKWKATNSRYVGEFLDNLKHGEGEMVYPDGSRYKGQFEGGKRNGLGTHSYANGDVYVGNWKDDLKHGKGEYTFKSTGSKKQGEWVAGVLTGLGEIIHADHKIFGKFISNESMEMPVKVTFNSTGNYTKYITDPTLLGQEPIVVQPIEV